MSILKQRLPKPDSFGNYWMMGSPNGPCILHSSIEQHKGKYFVSFGYDGGVILEGGSIKYFNTVDEAWEALLKGKR